MERSAHSTRRFAAARTPLAMAFLCGAVFVALSTCGRLFEVQPLGFPAFWPVSGLVLGLLIRRPPARWPLLILYFAALSVVDGFFRDEGSASIVAWAAAAVVGPLVGATVFSSTQGRGARIDRISVLFSAFLATLASATVSGAFRALAMPLPQAPLPLLDGWLSWSAAEALGSMAVLPILLSRWDSRWWREVGAPRMGESVIALVLLVFEAAVFVGPLRHLQLQTPIFEFLFVPILLWIPLRIGVPVTVFANALLIGFAALWADHGVGPFALTAEHRLTHLLGLQSLLLALTSLCLALAVAMLERRGAAARLRESEDRFRRLSDHAPIGIFQFDLSGRCLFVNRRWCDLTGMSPMEAGGVGWFDAIHAEDRGRVAEEWSDCARNREEFRSIFRLRDTRGRITWLEARALPIVDEQGDMSAYIGTAEDITTRRAVEERLTHLALHDPLTHLANRVLLRDRLEQALARLARAPGSVAVIYLDLDHFKEINDTHGHEVGDRLLQEIARRLLRASRPTDTVGRLGGDEFVVICPGLHEDGEASLISHRFEAELARPVELDSLVLQVTGSLGIRIATSADSDPDELLRDADVAMYEAKRRGRGRSELWKGGTDRRSLELESRLRGES